MVSVGRGIECIIVAELNNFFFFIRYFIYWSLSCRGSVEPGVVWKGRRIKGHMGPDEGQRWLAGPRTYQMTLLYPIGFRRKVSTS
jgi:hypothetical protein